MSLRPSRIHRIRKRGAWPKPFGLENDAGPSELQRLPVCLDDDEGDDCPYERSGETGGHPAGHPVPTVGVAAIPVDADSSRRKVGDADGAAERPADRREVPVKLRHLKVAAERGHLEAMYLLAQEADDPVSRIHWLTMAAERGHVPAMHDLGLASAALHERRRWLLRAAQHGWAEAMAELGDVECS